MEVILIISIAANIVALIAVFLVYKGMGIKVPKEEIEKIKLFHNLTEYIKKQESIIEKMVLKMATFTNIC